VGGEETIRLSCAGRRDIGGWVGPENDPAFGGWVGPEDDPAFGGWDRLRLFPVRSYSRPGWGPTVSRKEQGGGDQQREQAGRGSPIYYAAADARLFRAAGARLLPAAGARLLRTPRGRFRPEAAVQLFPAAVPAVEAVFGQGVA